MLSLGFNIEIHHGTIVQINWVCQSNLGHHDGISSLKWEDNYKKMDYAGHADQ